MSYVISILLTITIFNTIHVESIKFTIEPICLATSSPDSLFKLSCADQNTRLFITQQVYTNDLDSYCNKSVLANTTNNLTKCSAYPTQRLASECNGKQECDIKLDQTWFTYGFMGSNCNFNAELMFISYECIPVDFFDKFIPKYDICSGSSASTATNVIDHPIHGFIHSPAYPNKYQSRQFCQLTIRADESIERIEIFLIDMELEGLSSTTYKPTDYLQINSNEQLFGEKSFVIIYNETISPIIKFQTDRWFNKRGFLLYFQAIKAVKQTTTTTTTTTSTTTTTTTTQTTSVTSLATLNLTNSTNDTSIRSSYASIQAATRDSLNSSSNDTTASYLDMTTRLIFILIAVIGLLSVLLIVLLFTKRVTICGDPRALTLSKIELGNTMNETTNLDYYMNSTNQNGANLNKSLGVSCLNSTGPHVQLISSTHTNNPVAFYKINYLSNRPDDSQAQLLINRSSMEPVSTLCESVTSEVYEDIKLDYNSKKLDSHISENLKRCNEYCYIPSNVIKSDGEPVISAECGNGNLELANTSSSDLTSSSGLSSPSASVKVTSTPNATKYLEPTNFKETSNEYKIFMDQDETINTERTTTDDATLAANQSTLHNNINNDEDDLNYEYQIPSNLPTN